MSCAFRPPLPAPASPFSETLEINPHGICARALPQSQGRAWQVLHACEAYERISPVVEAESASGMLPTVVTPSGPLLSAAAQTAAAQVALLRIWNGVRNWRRVLLENAGNCELVHAHCFAAGMAAVRNFPTVVYEIDRFVEDDPNREAHSRSWLGRSFQVAEQFVVSRAAAVVARTPSLRQELVRRGAAEEHIFVIPRPVALPELPLADYLAIDTDTTWTGWRQRSGSNSAGAETFAVLSSVITGRNWQRWLKNLIGALCSASRQTRNLVFYLEADDDLRRGALRLLKDSRSILDAQVVDRLAAAKVLPACSLVVAEAAIQPGGTPVENPLALAALLAGKPLLAADLPCNRDVTPSGRGCLWFKPENAADLERRLLFLASDPGLCAALAASGARFMRETRSPLRIAEQYDAVYRYAMQRRRSGKLQTPAVRWQPSQACI